MGKGALAGGAALGIGAICFYGMGLSSDKSTIMNNSMYVYKYSKRVRSEINISISDRMWPDYVRERIHSTYAYFGGSVAITAASAAAIFRSPTLLNLASRTGWIPLIVTIALMMGTGMVARSIPYEEGIGAKQLAWATHCAVMVNIGLKF